METIDDPGTTREMMRYDEMSTRGVGKYIWKVVGRVQG